MPKRIKTDYPGVYYREVRRIGGKGTEKVFYIVFKKDNRTKEEKAGCQFRDAMTPAKAARYRAERIENKRESRQEIRLREELEKQTQENRWTIKRLWEAFKSERSSSRHLDGDNYMFEKHLAPVFGEKTPSEIIPLDVDRFRLRLIKEKSSQTVKYLIQMLVRAVNYGVKKQLCDGLNFRPELPRVNNIKTEFLDSKQIAHLLAAIEEDTHPLAGSVMKLALFTGMRRGEIFKLKWNDIDFERGFITLRDPKGGKDQVIPLNDAARDVFQNHARTPGSDYVFPGKNGGYIKELKRPLNQIKAKAGLPKDFRPLHGLRHTFASIAASSGKVDLYVLQRLLTHKTPAMTQRYAHLRDESLRKAAELVGQLVAEAVEKSKTQDSDKRRKDTA